MWNPCITWIDITNIFNPKTIIESVYLNSYDAKFCLKYKIMMFWNSCIEYNILNEFWILVNRFHHLDVIFQECPLQISLKILRKTSSFMPTFQKMSIFTQPHHQFITTRIFQSACQIFAKMTSIALEGWRIIIGIPFRITLCYNMLSNIIFLYAFRVPTSFKLLSLCI